jgi:ketosteroid isomerase-like protein
VEVGQIRSSGAAVFRVQGGKVTSIVIYFDRDRALADLGLEEQAASRENVTPDRLAALRKHFEAFTCGDFDEAMGIYSPDAVWDSSPLGTGVFAGREAIRGFYEDWRAAYEDSMIEIEEFRDLGNGVAYSVLLQSGRVRGSSGVLQMRYVVAAIWTNVLVKQATVYTDVHAGRSAAERLAHELG